VVRVTRLARRAWQMRDDPEAIVAGLNRLGVRIPGSGSYHHRSPEVGALVDRAWAGHVIRSLAELERLASLPGRKGRDAVLALSDWDITHGNPQAAIDRLEAVARLPRDGRTLAAEARQLTRAAEPNALDLVNSRLRRAGFASVTSPDGSLFNLSAPMPSPIDGPLVSVIVPAFNAEKTITSTITSLIEQSWRNLEIIVVDDASTDDTGQAVASFDDPRVILMQHDTNQGAYAARNQGLQAASGDFVTVNDADDWAHPSKIAVQVQHLINNPDFTANTTDLARVSDDLRAVRRGIPNGKFTGYNHSSLMLRTSLLRSLGGWDDVRVGADSELEARLIHLHGNEAIRRLQPGVPLTFARSDASSLTGDPLTGLASTRASTGARRLYAQAYTNWHQSLPTDSTRLERTSDNHPFPAPTLIRRRSVPTKHSDVVILSDLALPGGTTASNLAEVAANERAGWKTGLLHNRNPKYRDTGVNPKFFHACSDYTRLLSAGERVSCDVLVIKYPPSADQIPDVFPDIDVRREVVMIANQTPRTGYTGESELVYEIPDVDTEVLTRFGRSPLWFPISPAIRQVFETHHRSDVDNIRWAKDDWIEIIDVDAWKRTSRPHHKDEFRVGRHGRDSVWKWPTDAGKIRAAYPHDPPYMIDILGGADEARKVLGKLPANWRVRTFDSIAPSNFLAGLDAFVHVAHPDMEEAFGRTILEALAVGVPVITEPRFALPFDDAVIVSDAEAIRTHLDQLRTNSGFYDLMVQRGHEFVEMNFSYSTHQKRIEKLVG
jgi:glycosyltransferase involved in cell wall biosynthesis